MAYPSSFNIAMALPTKSFVFILFLLAATLLECQASVAHIKHPKPKFMPGPWKKAHATFYQGNDASFGMADFIQYINIVIMPLILCCF